MTWAYWADGGKPTINQQNPDEPGAYGACANDPYCSALAVQGYMQKFQQVRGQNIINIINLFLYFQVINNITIK